ncbi:deoxyribose-phosphate aldolase [Leucobacter sp. M11]|uniref:deoxyribose-phosphate aldolase n=1 Tax=Leucobacter sp. M11 TaxID=2993565 RepID=UPI002D809DD2|nr:deoxyribose-phosphate aldolase [Leucobacter sp. M11]MEB4613316.1 deoxyribose-phosphate aldolase [Leucobacter sp. M11]
MTEPISRAELAGMIDHTLLASDTTAVQAAEFLASARELGVARVCVSPSVLPLDKHGLEIVTVVGFPSGAHHGVTKAAETLRALDDGADEIDVVVNLGLVKAGDWAGVEAELTLVREASVGHVLKVIIESAHLTDDEIVATCRAAERAGADFVKTSTGFHPAGGATAHAVRLMRDTVGDALGVKASGGIRSAAAVREMLDAGATRLGLSGTAAILAEWEGEASDAPADASGY